MKKIDDTWRTQIKWKENINKNVKFFETGDSKSVFTNIIHMILEWQSDFWNEQIFGFGNVQVKVTMLFLENILMLLNRALAGIL